MSPEKWNALTVEQRRKAVLKHDSSGTMATSRWAPLVDQMTRPWDELTDIQRMVVAEMP